MENFNFEEQQYLNIIILLLEEKTLKKNRTGIPTLSLFGNQLRFSLKNNVIPLLTTKKVNYVLIIKELLWMLNGYTDNKILKAQNVNIWTSNSTKEFLEKNNLPYEEDDIGPGYGFQWRYFGAEYKDCKTDYTGQGIDQIKKIIDQIKNDPDNRRIILSAWNVNDIEKMALPPCHCFTQFYVKDGYLSCHLYQRSVDVGLGMPFNITSYALLTYILAYLTKLKPGDFIYSLGDYHIYENHIEQLTKQAKLIPYSFPTIKIKNFENLKELTPEHFEIENYIHHLPIKMNMAV